MDQEAELFAGHRGGGQSQLARGGRDRAGAGPRGVKAALADATHQLQPAHGHAEPLVEGQEALLEGLRGDDLLGQVMVEGGEGDVVEAHG